MATICKTGLMMSFGGLTFNVAFLLLTKTFFINTCIKFCFKYTWDNLFYVLKTEHI